MRAPERLETPRLVLRRPRFDDADAIFLSYASDPEVTRLLAWSRHRSVEDTRSFLAFSDAQWEHWPAGPYVIERAGEIIGATGLSFESPQRAMTGYVLARAAWGQGFATESLIAMKTLAPQLGVRQLYAVCHGSHAASARVLEKGGFTLMDSRDQAVFPNLRPEPVDVLVYELRC